MEALDHYNLLGVSRNASQGEILKAYKKKALEVHPDKNLGSKNCEELFKKLQKAKETLLDPEKRRDHDQKSFDVDPDFDGSVNLDAMHLDVGRRISEEFEIKIRQWCKEYEGIVLIDNVSNIASTIPDLFTALSHITDEVPDEYPATVRAYRTLLASVSRDLEDSLRQVVPHEIWSLTGIGRQQFSTRNSLTFALGRSYSRLGNGLFAEGKFDSALYCFQRSTSVHGAAELAARAAELVGKQLYDSALRYYRVLLDKTSHREDAILGILNVCLIKDGQAQTPSSDLKTIVFTAAEQYKASAAFHKMALDILMDQSDLHLTLGCMQTILALDTRDTLVIEKQTEIENSLHRQAYDTLKELLYAYCDNEKRENGRFLVSLVESLREKLGYLAAKKLYEDMSRGRDLNTLSAPFKAAMCILAGFWQMLEGNHRQAEQELLEAILTYPVEEVFEAASRLIDKNYMQSAVQSIESQFNAATLESFRPNMYMDRLKLSANLRAVYRYEKCAEKDDKMSNHDKALAYLDLAMAAVDSSMLCTTFALSATYFVKEMQQIADASAKDVDVGYVFALRNAVTELCMGGVVSAQKFEQPITELHLLKQFYKLFLRANNILAQCVRQIKDPNRSKQKEPVNIIRIKDKTFDTMMTISLKRLVKVTPFMTVPTVMSGDMLYLDSVCCEFLKVFYETKLRTCPPDHPWNYLYHYQLLEGCWKSGARDDDDFAKYRYNAMQALLERKAQPVWTMRAVETTMLWPLLHRDSEGFLDRSKPGLNFGGTSFDCVQGVDIVLKDGVPTHFQLRVVESAKDCPGLFDAGDILEIFQKGISSVFFTLDQPEFDLDYHPFQEMKYFPSSLEGTNYLQTLLHADYLLKTLSTGCEVSAHIPFPMQDANGENGFVQQLPEKLREVLKPPSVRRDGQKSGSAHRFWIDAGKIPYISTQRDNMLSYDLGYCPLQVKTHVLKRNADGELVDDEGDDDDEVTPEKEFATDLTLYYNEIGEQFPVLLRLRELHKLAAVYLILKNTANTLKDALNGFDVAAVKSSLKDNLKEIRKKVKYPVNTSSELNRIFREILRENGASESNVNPTEVSRVKNSIRSQLAQADETILENVSTALAEGHEVLDGHRAALTNHVQNWLANSRTDPLITLLTEVIKQNRDAKLSQFQQYAATLGIYFADDEEPSKLEDSAVCRWVPSAFHLNRPYRCYGGVLMNVSLEKVDISAPALDKRNKNFRGRGVLYVMEITYKGYYYDTYKRGISMAETYTSSGVPCRLHVQVNKVNSGRDPNFPYQLEDGYGIRYRYKIFDDITRADLERWEAAQKRNDILKYERTNPGDRDHAARKAREELAKRKTDN